MPDCSTGRNVLAVCYFYSKKLAWPVFFIVLIGITAHEYNSVSSLSWNLPMNVERIERDISTVVPTTSDGIHMIKRHGNTTFTSTRFNEEQSKETSNFREQIETARPRTEDNQGRDNNIPENTKINKPQQGRIINSKADSNHHEVRNPQSNKRNRSKPQLVTIPSNDTDNEQWQRPQLNADYEKSKQMPKNLSDEQITLYINRTISTGIDTVDNRTNLTQQVYGWYIYTFEHE